MENVYIEDTLHLIQGLDKGVKVGSVECLAINRNIEYIKSYELNLEPLNSLKITSKITLDYEAGFSAVFIMDYLRCIYDTDSDLEALLCTGEFELKPTETLRPIESILLIAHNKHLLTELYRLFPSPRDLSSRGDMVMIGSDHIARKFINEYQMALALSPYSLSDFFEESMRIDLHQKIKDEARKKLKHA